MRYFQRRTNRADGTDGRHGYSPFGSYPSHQRGQQFGSRYFFVLDVADNPPTTSRTMGIYHALGC